MWDIVSSKKNAIFNIFMKPVRRDSVKIMNADSDIPKHANLDKIANSTRRKSVFFKHHELQTVKIVNSQKEKLQNLKMKYYI